MNKTKARHNLLARFEALKHDTRTGGELTVRTNPQPSRAVRMPDPRSAQEVVTSLCETIHAVQAQNRALEERLATLEQGKFTATGQPATLTVTVRGGRATIPTVAKPPEQTNLLPCPMVQARAQVPDTGANNYSADTNYGSLQRNYQAGPGGCPLVANGNW